MNLFLRCGAASVSHRGTRWLAVRRVCLTLRSLLIRRSQILNRCDVVVQVDFRWRLINADSLSMSTGHLQECSHFPAVAAGGTKTFWAGCCQVLWSVTSQVSTQRYRSRLRQLWRHAWCLLNSIINVRAQTLKRLCTCYELCNMTLDASTQYVAALSWLMSTQGTRCLTSCIMLPVWQVDCVTRWPCDELTVGII